MLGATDAENLRNFLRDIGHSAGALHGHLQAAIVEDALIFGSEHWRTNLADYVVEAGPSDYYRNLLSRLSENEKSVLSILACHNGSLSADTIATMADMKGPMEIDAAGLSYRLGLIHRTEKNGVSEFSVVSEGVRQRLLQAIPKPIRRSTHSKFEELITSKLRGCGSHELQVDYVRQLSYHLEQLGEYRQAIKQLCKLLAHAVRVGDLFGVRRIAQKGATLCQSWCESHGADVAKHVRRYFTRALLQAEWKETNYDRICEVIQSSYGVSPSDVPTSFVPKYVRSLQVRGAVDLAERTLRHHIDHARSPSAQSVLHMKVELALVLRQSGRVHEALRLLNEVVSEVQRMNAYYKCRTYVHFALCYETLDNGKGLSEMSAAGQQCAMEAGLSYEIALTYQVRSELYLKELDLQRARSTIATAVRYAGKKRLHNILRGSYFQASALYFNAGDYERCERYLGKALGVAERLGDLRSSLSYLIRYAMIHQTRGLYGNALRYLGRAERLLDTVSGYGEETELRVMRLDVSLDLNTNDVDRMKERADAAITGDSSPNRIGFYHFVVGRYFELSGDLGSARRSCESARAVYAEAGLRDDEARAIISLIRVLIAQGNRDECKRFVDELLQLVEGISYPDIVAEAHLAELRYHMAFAGLDDVITRVANECDVKRRSVQSVPTLLALEQELYLAWLRVGRNAEATESFDRFYACVRKVIANLPTREMASCFLARADISRTLSIFERTRAE